MFWLTIFALYGTTVGPDATFDFRNYHLYNAYALVHGRLDFDIAPAQLMTWVTPFVDLPAYWLRWRLNARPDLLNAVLALPYGVAAHLTTMIALCFIPLASPWRWPLALLVAGFGASGAAALGVVATAQTDIIPDCFVLGGLLCVLLACAPGSTRTLATLGVGGLLFGVACALKLTTVVFGAAAGIALLVAWPGTIGTKLKAAIVFGATAALGLAVVGGWWWLRTWQTWGNPFFPLYNNVFHSPFAPQVEFVDARFKPKTLWRVLTYPFEWGFTLDHPATELVMRDARIALAMVAFVAALACRLLRRPEVSGRQTDLLLVFWPVAYLGWALSAGILRYIVPLEALCGVMLLLPLWVLARMRGGPVMAGALAGAVAAGTVATTIYPDWGRAFPRDQAISVTIPPVDPSGLVLILDPAPASYIVPFLPHSMRVVGVNNWVITPDVPTLLRARVQKLIAEYPGPLYGVESPIQAAGFADRSLAFYGLQRDSEQCAPVRSNLDLDRLVLCKLRRAG